MFGLQPIHIILIVVIGLLIFGPKPITNFIKSFRKAGDEFHSAVKEDNDKSKDSASSKPKA